MKTTPNTPKNKIRKLLDKLPEDSSLEDIQYLIYIREKIQNGLKDIKTGKLLSAKMFEARISKDSSYYAAAMVEEIRDAANSLGFFSNRGHVVPEYSHKQVREIFVRSYRLIYKNTADRVYILGIVHGARNLKELLRCLVDALLDTNPSK